jgi:RNA polymerase sigma-70 factor (ECF subfamily)
MLTYYQGLSNREAASALEVNVDALESLLARARRSLKDELAGEWRGLIGAGGQ